MILTVTPNPALDITGDVDNIVPNEKTYVFNERRFPGGNGINAARVIAALGEPVLATGFLGGAVGDEFAALLDTEHVRHSFVRIAGSTRVNVTVSNRKTAKQTRLSFPGPRVESSDIGRLCELIEGQGNVRLVNVGGSLPPGFSMGDLGRILKISAGRGWGAVVDVPGQHLREVVAMRPMLIKPNLTEFRELAGKEVGSIADVWAAARHFSAQVPLVCVSSVERGVVLVTPSGAWYASGPQVSAQSSVGAGDAMVGAMLAQLHRSNITSYQAARDAASTVIADVLRWGLAAALATIVKPGTELGDATGIDAFLPRIELRQL